MYTTHCDREGCTHWQRIDSEQPTFVTVTFPRTWNARPYHFCTLDCLLHWTAAHSTPAESVPNERNQST